MSLIVGISWLTKSLSGARTVYINECQYLMRTVMDRNAFSTCCIAYSNSFGLSRVVGMIDAQMGFGTTIDGILHFVG